MLLLSTCAYYIIQGYMFLDDAGKMNLLKYSRGDYQENLGVLKRISRNPARKSTTTIRVQLQGWLALADGAFVKDLQDISGMWYYLD